MAKIRTLDELTLSLQDFLNKAQPNLDIKPGQIARDLFIDLPASELAKLYLELNNFSSTQSIILATGSDLDRYGRNYGLTRKTGSFATGVVAFTVNNLESDVLVPRGTIVAARNGTTFSTVADLFFDSTKKSVYRSNALRISSDLNLAGITDQYAAEVAVQANSSGIAGRIGKFSIVSQSLFGLSNITNVNSFSGGSSLESHTSFRSRILSVFSGSSIGTSQGYLNAIKSDARVADAIIIEPGDPLMTRDGSISTTNANNQKIIISSGTGGKIDIVVQGSSIEQTSESFIFKDISGRNDPTDMKNDIILGQRGINPLLDYQQKRKESLRTGVLPFQPVLQVLGVSGSLSGPNFRETTDGKTKGSFELLKDAGAFGGSAFGFDRLHFISNQIELEDEQIIKTQFNSQDALDYTDISIISEAHQTVNIFAESPTVDSRDRSILSVKHLPVLSIDRVSNLTTGERYRIIDQNPDGVIGEPNTTGRFQIMGSTLPTASDILSVNYSWNRIFDDTLDFDNLTTTRTTRTVQDSIDWGFANRVEREKTAIKFSNIDGYYVETTHPISRVINVNTAVSESQTVVLGKITMSQAILNITSIVDNVGRELFHTSKSDGSFSAAQITLPTDTIVSNGSTAQVIYNTTDLFSPSGVDTGSFADRKIILIGFSQLIDVYVDYVADVSSLVNTTSLTNLPIAGYRNAFVIGDAVVGNQPTSNLYDGSGIVRSLRWSPTFLRINFGSISSPGRIAIRGTSYKKIDVVFTATESNLRFNLENAITSSGQIITPGLAIAHIELLERVSVSDGSVISVDHTFDTLNYAIKNAAYSLGRGFSDSSLSNTEILFVSTESNVANVPVVGQTFRVVFYVVDTNAVEKILVSTNGIQISKNRYIFIEKISVESGFLNLSGVIGGTLSIDSYTQPITSSQYSASYKYKSPKEGERITITYTYNKLLSDLINTIERVRPITADILIRAAKSKAVDVSVSVVATSSFSGGNTNLEQSIQDNISTFLNSNSLNTIVDYSDIIANLYNVPGLDRVVITQFNLSGETGVKKSISAARDEFITAGTVSVVIEER